MAGLFDHESRNYAALRPTYPPSLFSFLASLTPTHELAWDLATGNGQAAIALAQYYDRVIATDVSEKQLSQAQGRPNVKYVLTPPSLSEEEVHTWIGGEGSVDLVTVAQAIHWFDLDVLYSNVKHVLRKPGGIIAVWCYTAPVVDTAVDAVFAKFSCSSEPFWPPGMDVVVAQYKTLPFPFEAVSTSQIKEQYICKRDHNNDAKKEKMMEETSASNENKEGRGPLRYDATKEMTLDDYLTYLRTLSPVQAAKDKGIELLNEELLDDFRNAWELSTSSRSSRIVTFPMFVRIGTVKALI